MKIILKKIQKIKPYRNNPRTISEESIKKVVLSIKEFGFQQPIVVDKNDIIIAGHTRLLAAKQLQLKEVPVVIAKNLTDNQARAYRLMDNKSSEESQWDSKLLNLELLALKDNKINLDLTGFKDDEILSWDSNLEQVEILEADDSAARVRVIITSDPENKDMIFETVKKAIEILGFKNVEIS